MPLDKGLIAGFPLMSLCPCADETMSTDIPQAHPCLRGSALNQEEDMNFDQAIAAHSSWKQKLRAYLNKPDRSLNPTEIAHDNTCELGKWIAGEGAKHAGMAEFQSLRSEHSRFHKAAAEVVRQADGGQNVVEDVALGGKSEFANASSAVVSAIMALRAKVGQPAMSTR